MTTNEALLDLTNEITSRYPTLGSELVLNDHAKPFPGRGVLGRRVVFSDGAETFIVVEAREGDGLYDGLDDEALGCDAATALERMIERGYFDLLNWS